MTDSETGGKQCHGCGETHGDWEMVSEFAINSHGHVGVGHANECGNCGEHTEVHRV